jgi:DNA mismatch repair protein MSH6
MCQLTTVGTRLNSDNKSDLCYLTSMCGLKTEDGIVKVGLCFVDTSIGLVHATQFDDDKELSNLETLLALYPPTELIYDRNKAKVLEPVVGKFSAIPKRGLSFPEAGKTLKSLHDYYGGGKEEWPRDLADVHLDKSDNLGLTAKRSSELVMSAFGGLINYLADAMIDNVVLSQKQFKTIQLPSSKLEIDKATSKGRPMGSSMILDNKTLVNLDVIPSIESTAGDATLFSVIDKTVTSMGKRQLKQWLCMPLLRPEDIYKRHEAVKYFQAHPEVVEILNNDLKGMPDLERLVSFIHASGIKFPKGMYQKRHFYL